MSNLPPSPSLTELAREVLLHRMREYSEEYHCAGWLGGLEFLLWETPSSDDDSPAAKRLRNLVPELQTLAEIADGWWAWDSDQPAADNPVFIPMTRWLQVLAEHQGNNP